MLTDGSRLPGRLLVALVLALGGLAWTAGAATTLEIWFIDVEGGQATLIVTPAGESMLVDAGYSPQNWRGATPAVPNGRDPSRILEAAKQAGISKLDYLLVTHFHPDHVGGVPDVASKLPVGTFIDYGAPFSDDASTLNWFRNYEPVRTTGKHQLAVPGDRVPLKGLDVTIVSAGGALISTPLAESSRANSSCSNLEDFPEDGTENFRSIGFVVRFGAFRFLDLGDLSGNTLTGLACPRDLIGPVSVYLIAHHGDYDTNVPTLYGTLRPRVAIMNNGPMRGGDPDALKTLHGLTGLEGLWQLHTSQVNGARNAPDMHIANTDDGTAVKGYSLHLTAFDDGSFRIVNGRTGFVQTYAARRGR